MPDYAGNSLLAAREISLAIGSQTFSDRVDTFDPDDYYRINLSGRSSLNLAVNGLSANANVQLLDRNGNTLRSSTNSAGIAESINQVLDANTYYIRVYQDSSANTDYTLNLQLQNSPKTDLFWRDYSTGANVIWFMGGTNNTTITSSTSLPSVATNWRVEGIADFNGDNRPDLLWRDYSSGANAVWFMGGTNNATITSSTYLTSVSTNWHIEGTADFNGDNRPDLIWRDYSSGANVVWFMGGTNNTTITSSTSLTSVSTNWHIEGTADFNGDNRPDLIWRDYSSGANAVWFMGGTDNTTVTASTSLTSVGTNWRVEGIADFNGDNRPDLFWRDYSSGTNAVWFMGGTNNATIMSSTSLTSVSTNWQALPYTRYEEPLPIDLAGNTTNTAFNVGTLSSSGTFSDRIDTTDPNDYYQFTLASTSTVNLSLNGLSANADIQLLSSSGTVIQGSYNSNSSAESIGTTLSAGTYYVRVYQSSGSTNYSLNLSATVTNANLYYFTYSYGNGDSYQGYGYTTDTSYYSGRYIYDSTANETGKVGYYVIGSTYTGYDSSYNNKVYVYSYYNSETSANYTPYSGSGSNGLGSEYGYLTNGDSNTYYGGKYYEADLGYQYYTFKYSYGSGQDYYTGYGYTDYGKYTTSQSFNDSLANETGNYGSYLIIGITNYTSGTATLNTVRVSSYYNSETSTTYTPYSGSGSSGLGSEYGYVTNGDGNTYYGGKSYEADFGYQYYTFKYSYGSGQDYYTGYGYTDYGKYINNQTLNDTLTNETGNYGSYQITGITNYTSGTVTLNTVRVSSYYNSENSTSYTPYSGSGSTGLGSESGYLTSAQTFSNDYFGGKYYEADVAVYKYNFTYYYNGSSTSADYYTGYVYAYAGSYTVGSYFDYSTSNNQAGYNGKYYINSYTVSGTSSDLNRVYATTYYDVDSSGRSYSPEYGNRTGYASGYNGLGREGDFINDGTTSYSFGYDYSEADIPKPTTIDLTGSSFSLSSTSLTAGNTVTAYFGVQNTGTGNAGSFNVKFYLSTDSTINTSDKYLSLYTINSLNSGLSTGTLSTSLILPSATDSFWNGSGTYFIGMVIDADSSINESNEANNTAYQTITFTAQKAVPTTYLPFDASKVFSLNSNLGANQTIYLDFDGHVTTNTSWNTNGNSIVTPAFDTDGNTSSFSTAELETIWRIWQRVAEDFIPFNVNVTTVLPSTDRLIKSGSNDTQWGIRVAIGGDGSWYGSAGGVAYVSSFNWDTDTPAFVFSKNLSGGSEKSVAEAISHEVGHTLGLEHDGNATAEYDRGHGSGVTGWAPIMGVGYYQELSQWSKGEYANANNAEDDLATITTQNGFGYRVDDYGNQLSSAAALQLSGSSTETYGIIETNTDVDWFSFTSSTGNISLNINPFVRGPNLDLLATLYNSSGQVIQVSNPTEDLSASFNLSLAAGKYYLSLKGTGKGDTNTGYSAYGSLGQYSITGTIA